MAIALYPVTQFFDDNGAPLSGGKVWTYAAGTLTPLGTWTNQDGNVANANPVILDAAGRAQIWLTPNVPYKIRVTDSANVELELTDEYYAGMNPEQLSLAGLVPASGGTFTGPVNFNGAVLFGGTEAQELAMLNSLGLASVRTENLFLNSDCAIAQRTLGAASDAGYGLDQIVNLTQTASTTLSQLAQPTDGIPFAMRITQSNATPQRVGFAQIVEARKCWAYRGSQLVFVPKVRCSVGTTIRAALVAWTGTADAPTRDVVNIWTSTNFTAGNFFVANTATIAVGAVAVNAATWTDVPVSSVSAGGVVAPSTMNNLYFVVWSDSTLAQNVTLDASVMRAGKGTEVPLWTPPDPATELPKCQRFLYRLTGAANAAAGTGLYYGTTTASIFVPFPISMRTAPSITVGSTGSWVALISGGTANLGAGAPLGATVSGAEINFPSAAAGTAGAPIVGRIGNVANFIEASAEF